MRTTIVNGKMLGLLSFKISSFRVPGGSGSAFHVFRVRLYLTERIHSMVYLKLIHPRTRRLSYTSLCHKIKLTGLWVN